MSALVADTHAVVWFLCGLSSLSTTARSALELASRDGDPVYVASISLVEIAYLVEKGRLPVATFDRLDQAHDEAGSGWTMRSLDQDDARSLRRVRRDLVPDMPDRIIAATAMHLGLPLVTGDRKIQATGILTIW
jgi:PIN domain nuclease of toxin-antitoxin system